MPADTLICGVCQKVYTDLNEFLLHKQEGCAESILETTLAEADRAVSNLVASAQAVPVFVSAGQTLLSKTVITPQTVLHSEPPIQTTIQLNVIGGTPAKGRKRGRPRKSEQKKKPVETEPEEIQEEAPPPPVKDGKIHCAKCSKSFIKARHFKTHRCLAATGYVDISRKELKLDSNDEDEVEEDEEERTKKKAASVQIVHRVPMVQLQQLEANFAAGDFEPPAKRVRIADDVLRKIKIAEETVDGVLPMADPMMDGTTGELEPLVSDADPKLNESAVARTDYVLDELQASVKQKNLPIFQNPEEKEAFEKMLKVDLSCVDHLFKVHMVQQETNDMAPPPSSRTSDQLSLYSCNVCNKVFKSLSHCRYHCIIHTDSKPFKCYKCDYSSNSKGNLYTHVRRHTGQMYRCSHCTFKTANRTHLVEHESIHTGLRQPCHICKKDYSSVKSLINHVRVYHKTKNGREYLEKLNYGNTHEKGVAVLHQCHVCNRKFKKKNDRDRHLFIHNIQVNPEIQSCELCGYMVSRRIYMEKHIQKHRVIYKCCLCHIKFPSVIRLNQHLHDKHADDISQRSWEDLFEKCITSSLFLPEPGTATGPTVVFEAARNDCKLEVIEVSSPQDDDDPSTQEPPQPDSKDIGEAELSNPLPEPLAAETENQSENQQEDQTDPSAGNKVHVVTADYNDLFKKLKYQAMNMDVFQKLRNQYGNEECEFCGKLFYSKTDFEPHHRTHTGDKPFACDQCDFKAVTKDNLKRHIERQHMQLTFPCPKCGFVGESRQQLWRHEQKHREPSEVQCPKCDLKLDNVKKLKNHMTFLHPDLEKDEVQQLTNPNIRPHGKIGKRAYKCPYCPKLFLRASTDLQKHIWIHQGIKPFKCPVCPHACRSKNNLAAHMLRHSSEKPYLCTECGKAYKSKTALRWHYKTHKDGKMFKCSRCDYEAIQKSHLKRHEETHYITKKYVCQHCDYSSNTLGYMKIHYTRKHKGFQYTHNPGSNRPLPADAKVFRCLSCDYLFGNLTDMKRHLKVRHHIKLENVDVLEAAEVMTQIVPNVGAGPLVPNVGAEPHVPQQEIQKIEVLQVCDQSAPTTEEADASTALQTLRYSVPQHELDEKTASAISILQQIVDISQQSGTMGEENVLSVPDGDGERMVTVDTSSIIVQQDGQEMILATEGEGQQYVIQYVTQDEMAAFRPSNISNVEQVITEGGDEVIAEMNTAESMIEIPVTDADGIVNTDSYITSKSDDIAMATRTYIAMKSTDIVMEEVVQNVEERTDVIVKDESNSSPAVDKQLEIIVVGKDTANVIAESLEQQS